jgi:hypothetical protein
VPTSRPSFLPTTFTLAWTADSVSCESARCSFHPTMGILDRQQGDRGGVGALQMRIPRCIQRQFLQAGGWQHKQNATTPYAPISPILSLTDTGLIPCRRPVWCPWPALSGDSSRPQHTNNAQQEEGLTSPSLCTVRQQCLCFSTPNPACQGHRRQQLLLSHVAVSSQGNTSLKSVNFTPTDEPPLFTRRPLSPGKCNTS